MSEKGQQLWWRNCRTFGQVWTGPDNPGPPLCVSNLCEHCKNIRSAAKLEQDNIEKELIFGHPKKKTPNHLT